MREPHPIFKAVKCEPPHDDAIRFVRRRCADVVVRRRRRRRRRLSMVMQLMTMAVMAMAVKHE